MEVKETMTFLDEDGQKVELEVVAEIFLEEQPYLVLAHVNSNNEDAFVFRVDMEEGKEVLNLVEDETEFKNVKKEYTNLLYNKE